MTRTLGDGTNRVVRIFASVMGVIALSVLPACSEPSEPEGFLFPFAADVDQELFVISYFDQDEGPGGKDYRCGPKATDEHTGLDIALANFVDMDAYVPVVASAEGVVLLTHDGEFDRETERGPRGPGNYVAIEHSDGLVSTYAHLANGSVAVAVGDKVAAGEMVGYVGSSGDSNIPHLHLEFVQDGVVPIDPFAGECGSELDLWAEAPIYDNAFRVVNAGTTLGLLDLEAVLAVPEVAQSVTPGEYITFWVQVANIESEARIEFVNPFGLVYGGETYDFAEYRAMNFVWFSVSFPSAAPEGLWTTKFYHDDVLETQRTFELIQPPSYTPSTNKGLRAPVSGSVSM